MKTLIQAMLKPFDVTLTRRSSLEQLRNQARSDAERARSNAVAAGDLGLLQALPADHASRLLELLDQSRSQLRQDLFVLSRANFKTSGFFVEIGAADGVHLSNTYLLETAFGWRGILAEPARCWHANLADNRDAAIETDCVWKESGRTLTFNEVSRGELSTIDAFSDSDFHRAKRSQGNRYEVNTISLDDLLAKHGAPRDIDYLSIDTEGSEYEILSHVDFDRYSFSVITCEHNFSAIRDEVFRLLTNHGYERVLETVSRFDDWYVRRSR